MDYATWQKNVDAALEAGFYNLKDQSWPTVDEMPAADRASVIDAAMSDADEALETVTYALIPASTGPDHMLARFVELLRNGMDKFARDEEAPRIHADLGRALCELVWNQYQPRMTERLQDLLADGAISMEEAA